MSEQQQEEQLRAVLSDAQRRKIAEFCYEPHSSDEIMKGIKTTWGAYSGDQLASDLRALETIKAIIYTEDKWKTAEPAKKVLKKYFGIP